MSLHEKAAMFEEAELLRGFEFTPWPKTPRLFRDVVVTEKLDGTNAAIHIKENKDLPGTFSIAAQSRRRLITPGRSYDNFGFAGWVHENAAELIHILGPGVHFGEWWGKGIQRGYGMERRVFSVFNVERWYETGADGLDSMSTRAELSAIAEQIAAVPILYRGPLSEPEIMRTLRLLKTHGSSAAPNFMNPEGVCVYHSASRQVFKVTLDANDAAKWESAA
ncbi:RNA ligase family protein [Streptomyces sp. CAU 1734]|uniref:RNA ligase family protein n=1 Tax=Streptomyces sp. CAU 1734 TaxID=3140360 RepID=UPI003261A7C0